MERMGVSCLVTCKTWHFEGLRFMSQSSSHCLSLRRPSSDRELMHRYMAVSSANNRSLGHLYMPRRGLFREQSPETGIELELVPLVTTDCFLLSKNAFIHFRVSSP